MKKNSIQICKIVARSNEQYMKVVRLLEDRGMGYSFYFRNDTAKMAEHMWVMGDAGVSPVDVKAILETEKTFVISNLLSNKNSKFVGYSII